MTPAIVQLSYRWFRARMMPNPIIDIGRRANAPDAQNAFAPGMANNAAYGERRLPEVSGPPPDRMLCGVVVVSAIRPSPAHGR